MAFSIRPYRRFPICYPVTYHAGLCEGRGMVWNLSANGWRLSGDVPLRVGQTCPCPLTVNLPDQHSLFVAGVTVRWVRGQEYGVETVVVEKQVQSRVEHWVTRLAQESVERTP